MRRLIFLFLLAVCQPFMAHAQTYSFNGVKSDIVIDVRTPEEFSAGHINGAINIPYDRIEANRSLLDKIKKDDNVLVYCRSGRRSEIAKQTLNNLGYKNVQNGGGMDSLTAKLKTCTGATC